MEVDLCGHATLASARVLIDQSKFKDFEEIVFESKRGLLKAQKEGDLILKNIESSDYVVLLDEKGKRYSSIDFSNKISSLMLSSKKKVVFLVGGAYGVSDLVYSRVDEKLSLSTMTFSHQMVRLFFMEQFYRSLTLLNNEPYHHQ